MISESSRVVVVGGGALGCAIAFFLARAALQVTLIERDDFGQHASGKNAGNLNPLFMTPPKLIPFALESFRMHLELAKELADLGCASYALEPVRRILLAFDEAEVTEFPEIAALFNSRPGFSARVMERPSVRAIEPRLSEGVRSGILLEGNASLDGRGLTQALVQGAARLGATVAKGAVRALKTSTDRVNAVAMEDREIPCEAVVLATGPWIEETKKWLGISVPVKPLVGQMLRMRLPGAGLGYDFTHGTTSLYRRGEHEVWVGATHEQTSAEAAPTADGRRHLQNEAKRIMPEMAKAELLEHTAAARPMSASGLPIIEQAPGWENVYIANGGGAKGMLLCTGIAQATRELMLTGRVGKSLNLETFSRLS